MLDLVIYNNVTEKEIMWLEKLNVFMIMPFQEQFLGLYEMIKNKLGGKYNFSNAGDLDNKQNILQDIVTGIAKADVIIADVTGLNPNVFYELGLCHALDKKVILITQDISELPFDIKSYRVDEYTTEFWKTEQIINKIDKNLEGAKDGSVQYGNPIKDFYPKDIVKLNNSTHENSENFEEDEKGFLDYVADINEDTNKLTEELNKMIEEQNEMTQQMEFATNEINRVSKSPSSGNAGFVRNIARKVGSHIQEFSNKMELHNNEFEDIWRRIENNFLDLIDNKYMENDDNKEGLINSLIGLNSMKNSIIESNDKIEEMISSFSSIKGMERKLTQAVNSLEEQMKTYIFIMQSAYASIDRIINKAELLVGKIDFEINDFDKLVQKN